jgi:hypothetical protein
LQTATLPLGYPAIGKLSVTREHLVSMRRRIKQFCIGRWALDVCFSCDEFAFVAIFRP